MFHSLTPFVAKAHEHNLIDYMGIVRITPLTFVPVVYASPGVQVEAVSTGVYRVWLIDKLPVYPTVLNQNPPAANMTCIDAGFGSTLVCYASLRALDVDPSLVVLLGIAVGKPVLVSYSQGNQVYFEVRTTQAGVAAPLEFSFKIEATAVLEKDVPRLGNLV